jgi:hypothetical protein
MDITPKIHIRNVTYFNEKPVQDWHNDKEPAEGTKVVDVFVDVSGSMNQYLPELKLLVSLLKALGGLPAVPPIPEPADQTNLLGVIQDALPEPTGPPLEDDDARSNVILITDGYDNVLPLADGLAVGWAANAPVINALPRHAGVGEGLYHERRQQAVLEHLTKYRGAEVALVGVGENVTQMLRIAERLPVTVAHVEQTRSDADVAAACSIVNHVVGELAKPRAERARSRASSSGSRKPRVINKDYLKHEDNAHVLLKEDDALVKRARATAKEVTIENEPEPAMTFEQFAARVHEAEVGAGFAFEVQGDPSKMKPEDLWLLKFTRAALLFHMSESRRLKRAVPGALLGGSQTSLMLATFARGTHRGWQSVFNRLLSKLKAGSKSGQLLEASHHPAKDKEAPWRYTSENNDPTAALSWSGVPCYAPSALANGVLEELEGDVHKWDHWALPRAEFIERTKLGSGSQYSSTDPDEEPAELEMPEPEPGPEPGPKPKPEPEPEPDPEVQRWTPSPSASAKRKRDGEDDNRECGHVDGDAWGRA